MEAYAGQPETVKLNATFAVGWKSQIFCTYTKRCVANEEPRQRSVCAPHAPRKTPMELP